MHDELIEALQRAPGRIRAAIDGLPRDALTAHTEDEWSVAQILGHIRAADLIWRTRALLTLVTDGITMPNIDERVLQAVMDTSGLSLEDQLAAFALHRTELTGILSSLSDDEWSRTCVHSSAGPLSLVDVCGMLEEHEREHLDQLEATAASRQ